MQARRRSTIGGGLTVAVLALGAWSSVAAGTASAETPTPPVIAQVFPAEHAAGCLVSNDDGGCVGSGVYSQITSGGSKGAAAGAVGGCVTGAAAAGAGCGPGALTGATGGLVAGAVGGVLGRLF
ncbi:hypothetical protein [Rhodococcoides corynebacterioides]|uniref:Bacteriocin n=1 Tax=Rhodococcoides corynebacterioides TaxID=53972 RepID=A0ABS7P472_9NOCA|nr:hypothetical protein [Rhodococcus corynebacterioides]MBY6367212.1 hypothetical protein [Rhodococcus corynebacterioides]MBY6407374.1 hypothetical protein [Rhodococcus corynebacterioides]